MQVIYPRCHPWSQRTNLAHFSTLPCGGLLSGNDFGRCIGLSCLKKWDEADKVGRCRPSCLEPQCTNLGALRLFACPCVVLMSRSLLRGTAPTAVPTKTANLFAGWHIWARPPFDEKPGGRKLDFTDLMDEFLGWHGRWRRWLGARGWRSCRERVVEFSATSPRWPFELVCSFAHKCPFQGCCNRWCYERLLKF